MKVFVPSREAKVFGMWSLESFDTFFDYQHQDHTERRWTPQLIKLATPTSENVQLGAYDATLLGPSSASIMVTPRAARLLASLNEFAEFLPLKCPTADLFLLNPLQVMDALDHKRSEVLTAKDGRLLMISRHVFREEPIRGVPFFRLTPMRTSPVFFTDIGVDRWTQLGLKGIRFKEVWSAI